MSRESRHAPPDARRVVVVVDYETIAVRRLAARMIQKIESRILLERALPSPACQGVPAKFQLGREAP